MTTPAPPPPEDPSADGRRERSSAGDGARPREDQSCAREPGTTPSYLAIPALVFGILALVLTWTVFGGIALGLLAVITGVLARRRTRDTAAIHGRLAVAGATLGAVGMIVSVFLAAFGLVSAYGI